MTHDNHSPLSLNASFYLGNRISLIGLGLRKPLGQNHSLLSRKNYSSLQGQSSAIKSLTNHSPLIKYSQFLLSPQNPTFSEPIIDNHAESEYINTGVTFIEFDNVDVNEEITHSLDNQNIDNNPPQLNNQSQSKSKKSQKSSSSQEKSKAKPKTTKKAKSSVKDKGKKQGKQINLSAADDAASTAINLENNQVPQFIDSNDRNASSLTPNTIFLDPPLRDDLISEETPEFTDATANNAIAESGIIFHDENIADNLTRSPKDTTAQTPINQGLTSQSPENTLTNLSKNNIESTVSNTASSDINIHEISQKREADSSVKSIKKPVLSNEQEVFVNRNLDEDNIIAEQSGVTFEDTNLSDISESKISSNIPVNLAPTPPIIFNPVEPTEEVYVDSELNADNIISNQPIVASEAVNSSDVSENVIARKSDIPSNTPVELTPTPPVIFNPLEPTEKIFVERELNAENIIPNQPIVTSETVNLDVRENAIAQKSENPHIPVELNPTPPVIADNIVNLDVTENAIAQKSENPNLPVDLTPTPPVIFNPVEATEQPTDTDNIIPHQPTVTSQAVNLDIRENAITRIPENPNLPVELTPNPPVIADNQVNVDVRENAIAQKSETPHIPVELTPTPPVIFNPVEATEEPINTDNIIPNQPTVASQAVNVDVRENAIAQKSQITHDIPVIADNPVNLDFSENAIAQNTENPNIPVDLTPTPPIIFNPVEATEESIDTDNIIPNQPTVASQAVNVDVSDNPNIPVELTPTPPVIADNAVNLDVRENAIAQNPENPHVPVPVIVDNPTVASQTLNLLDAPVTQVSALDNSQVNTDIPTGVTPPLFSENTEIESDSASKITQFKFTKNQTQNLENLPAPQGYATGGQVTPSSVENPRIASSDTVPAMLTPGEFVINANDAQKNLHILRHINTGGAAEDVILPSLEIPTPENPTKVDSFSDNSLQRHPADLGTEISQQRLSPHHSLPLNHVNRQATAANPASPHYSPPTLIFRKPSVTQNTAYETPNQWTTVEELLNESNDPFTFFNLNNEGESNWQNSSDSQSSQSSSTSPQVFTKRLSPQGFANGGEVTAPDIATDIPPITETIQNPSAANPEADESANLEALAYEIYNRLRQKIEVERERQGIYLGRLPW